MGENIGQLLNRLGRRLAQLRAIDRPLTPRKKCPRWDPPSPPQPLVHSIGEILKPELKNFRHIDQSLDAFMEQVQVGHPEILEMISSMRLNGTTMVLSVTNSSFCYLVSGWARGEGLSLAREVCRKAINRVKVVVEVGEL